MLYKETWKTCILTIDEKCAVKYREVYTDSVGQYTGLTDKNGEKIFEGDICKLIYHEPRYTANQPDKTSEHIEKVVFKDGKFGIMTWSGVCYPLWEFDKDDREVIGNIHDNPELLEANP